jgi:uncharacterized membrane protein
MLKIISTKPRAYRVKRKSAKPKKRFSAFNAAVTAIAFLSIAIAIPLLLIAAPFVLCAVGLLLIANACNETRVSEYD